MNQLKSCVRKILMRFLFLNDGSISCHLSTACLSSLRHHLSRCLFFLLHLISLRATSPSFDSPLNIWTPVAFSPPSPNLIRLELESSPLWGRLNYVVLLMQMQGRKTCFHFKGERTCTTSCPGT